MTYRVILVSDPIQGIDRCAIMNGDEVVSTGDVSEYEDMQMTVAIMNLVDSVLREQNAEV